MEAWKNQSSFSDQTGNSTQSANGSRPILRRRAAAEYLGISERSLHTLLSNGEIPYVKLKRAVLIRVSDIEAFLDRHSVNGGQR